ncbi:MAG: alpha/beta hydrolase [Clostridia bacterium]|nr:alpha/beta hydrolase [Clostridia bacterium]
MTIIEEKEYSELMKNEVEPYLDSRKQEQFVSETWHERKNRIISGKIHLQSYLADNPKGVIIISHGFTEGAPKYDEMIYYFLKAGYHVYMPEHMGHGLSYRLTEDPSLVHIDCWKRYAEDFLLICHEIKQKYPDLPLNLFAHSMGGAIGAIAASFEPELFHKIILSSPMIRPLTGNVPWPLLVMIAHVQCLFGKEESYVAGQKPYDGSDTFETSAATSKARFERYNEIRKAHKELQTSAASYGWLRASIKMSWYLRYCGWKKLARPMLIFQAEKDDFVSVKALQKFADKIKKQGNAACEYISMPGTKHEIYCSGDEIMKAYVGKILEFLV